MTPNSSPLTSIYVPEVFGIDKLSSNSDSTKSKLVYNTDYTFELDQNGKLTTIKLYKIPFINFRNYNIDTKSWFQLDKFENRWSKDSNGNYVCYDGLTYVSDTTFWKQQDIIDYTPIILSINAQRLTDITNYTGNLAITPSLNTSDTYKFKEFYFNKVDTIYTNQDLIQYNPEDISIQFDYINPNVKVKSTLNTNSFGIVDYTPTVDYYILNMIGQDIQ